jgi:hypothetical protein
MPMRQLRNCDFCGGDAAGVYEVLPPELSPTEAEQHRVVLCSDCVGTLEAAVRPLLERLGVDPGAEDADPTPDSTDDPLSSPAAAAGGASAPSGTPDRSAEAPTGQSDDAESTRRGGDGGAVESSRSEAEPDRAPSEATDDSEPSPDDPRSSDGEGPSDHHNADDPIAWGADESTPAEDTGTDPVQNGIPSIDPAGGTPDAEGEPSAEDGGNTEDTDDADTAGAGGAVDGPRAAPGGEPEEFRTVMRLLNNREFPVERRAIVELAASAYELDDAHVNQCLDYAVDRGVFDDDGGTLRRG